MPKKISSFITRQEMVSDSFEAFHYRDRKLREVSFHQHDFYEVYLFVDGNADYRVDAKEYELKPGSLMLMPPGLFHQPLVLSDLSCERLILWISRDCLRSLTPGTDLSALFQKERPVLSTFSRYAEIYRLMSELADEPPVRDALEEIRCRSLLSLLFVEIGRLSAGPNTIHSEAEASGTLQLLLSVINDRFREELSLDSLADRCFINKYYLSHLFKEKMGISVYRYILLKRLSFARELLADGSSAKDACFLSGFGDYSNFSRSYKSEFGISPGKEDR